MREEFRHPYIGANYYIAWNTYYHEHFQKDVLKRFSINY